MTREPLRVGLNLRVAKRGDPAAPESMPPTGLSESLLTNRNASSRWRLLMSYFGSRRRYDRFLLQPHRRQRLAAGDRIRERRAHVADESLAILRISKPPRGDLRGVHLKIAPHEFRVMSRSLLGINARIAQG